MTNEITTIEPTRTQRTASWLKDALIIWGVGAASFSTLFSIVVYFAANEITEFVSNQFGIDQLATSAEVKALADKIDDITGENRFLIVRLEQSYVLEPVSQGEDVTARYMMRRTVLGSECTFIASTPIFRDVRDIGIPGVTLTPPQQVGLTFQRVQSTFRPPDNLIPGRIELSLSLEYRCDGKTRFDEVMPLAYIMLS